MKQRTLTTKLLCGFLLVGAVSFAMPLQSYAEPSAAAATLILRR